MKYFKWIQQLVLLYIVITAQSFAASNYQFEYLIFQQETPTEMQSIHQLPPIFSKNIHLLSPSESEIFSNTLNTPLPLNSPLMKRIKTQIPQERIITSGCILLPPSDQLNRPISWWLDTQALNPETPVALFGNITLKLKHYFELSIHFSNETHTLNLTHSRRLKSDQLNYIDHPSFALLIYITPNKLT